MAYSIFQDFVGLNTFIYEANGWYPKEQIIDGSTVQDKREKKHVWSDSLSSCDTFAFNVYLNQIGMDLSQTNVEKQYYFKNCSSPFNLFDGHSHATASHFHAAMLRRNGPYGYCSWKQIRISDNHCTRKQRKHNIFTIVQKGKVINVKMGKFRSRRIRERYGRLVAYHEPIATSKYSPLVFNVGNETVINNQPDIRRFSIKTTLGNETEYFSNRLLNQELSLPMSEDNENYSLIKSYYLDGALDETASPIDSFRSMKYKEKIYPREVNTYKAQTRGRTRFIFPWRTHRLDRTDGTHVLPKTERFGYSIVKESVWPLDAWEDFDLVDNSGFEPAGRNAYGQRYRLADNGDLVDNYENAYNGGEGVLLNGSSQLRSGSHDTWSSMHYNDIHFSASMFYSRRHTLSSSYSVVGPGGMNIPETGSGQKNYRNNANGDGHPPQNGTGFGQGTAKWEAGDQCGYFSSSGPGNLTWVFTPKEPFYDSYDSWAQQIRLRGQGYTVVPEYRMSTKVEDFSINSDDPNSNLDIFELTGTALSDSSQANFYETYSTTDFLKHFKILKDDHHDFADPAAITLKCTALKKFLPYEGFYPCQRTVQLAERFYESVKVGLKTEISGATEGINPGRVFVSLTELTGAGGVAEQTNAKFTLQNLLTPLFAPGILFNTIKSGIAVDYPIYTGSVMRDELMNAMFDYQQFAYDHHGTGLKEYYHTQDYSTRIPFEAIVNPYRYLANVELINNESCIGHSIPNRTLIWNGEKDGLYEKMASNFFAEIPNFFLKGGQLTEALSLPQEHPDFGRVQMGGFVQKTYGMRLRLRRTAKNPNYVFYDYQDPNGGSAHNVGYQELSGVICPQDNVYKTEETFTMYSRPSAFGPDTYYSTGAVNGNPDLNAAISSAWGWNFPFTPPYYHGDAWCDLYFTVNNSGKYSLHDILSRITASYSRYEFPTASMEATVKVVNDNAMQLSASFNIFGTKNSREIVSVEEQIKTIERRIGKRISSTDQIRPKEESRARWSIKTKMETPMLNFNHVAVSSSTLSLGPSAGIKTLGTHTTPRGMWHQYGRTSGGDGTGGDGVYFTIEEVPKDHIGRFTSYNPDRVWSLATLVGMDQQQKKIGTLANQKVINEAVVAVPYFQKNNKKAFFHIPRHDIRNAQGLDIPSQQFGAELAGDSVRDMVLKMEKYVFPPSMDFLRNKDIEPFAMYIFEFSHTLKQKDLQDIWQNLPPTVADSFEESVSTISHPLFSEELLGSGHVKEKQLIETEKILTTEQRRELIRKVGQPLPNNITTTEKREVIAPAKGVLSTVPNNIRWMVFKVKQRAMGNYWDHVYGRNLTGLSTGTADDITYNWPYDFFSLVELIKIDAEIDFMDMDKDSEGRTVIKDKISGKRRKFTK